MAEDIEKPQKPKAKAPAKKDDKAKKEASTKASGKSASEKSATKSAEKIKASKASSTKPKKSANTLPMWKQKPLVRSGNTIYYGNSNDEYVARLDIKDFKQIEGVKIPSKFNVMLIEQKDDNANIIKNSEKDGLYNAIDLADAWLSRSLKTAQN